MNPELNALQQSDWYYDEMQHVGLDFADPAQVAAYDRRQMSTDAAAASLLEELGVRAGELVADFGCGTAVLACQAALMGCTVHAIDIAASMLAATKKRAKFLGAGSITIQQAGFLSFFLPAASLDFATSQYALHHLNDFWKLIALERVFAVLKPGGTLLLRDVVYSCHASELKDTVDSWLRWMQEERGYSRDENVTHVRDEHSTFSWEMEGFLERAGFQMLSSRFARAVYATYIAQRPQ